ncbi:peptide MFS transporter [Sphingomonas oryzagri]|uniref:Peptide MFS transporter n=1 Tax=Sphingomonas oryzagri TaxID=3042314 RepID=A0ABT6N780_9SPHN|nr:peptide MFS transporter [Sphingomonas oryzagri]MDH7640977.1 peptide MFS transporter [Sphingomonas oryzagri]
MTARRHPRGLAFLALTEAWERFSFYGMQALLVLYMVTTLLPAHPEQKVLGFAGFRATVEAITGPLSTQALASQIFGLYAGLVYLTPLLGGLVGDRLLGGRRTVLLGAALMAAGHFLLAFDASFLIALALLILGSGCLKGNIATQVGRLYEAGDARRDRAYLLFNFGINIGAFAGPLVCGTIGEAKGAHWGFASAGFGMLIGILIYGAGWRWLPNDRPRGRTVTREAGQAGDGRRIAALLGLVLLSAFYNVPFGEGYNVFPLWVDAAADRHLFGFEMPVAWYLASDGLVTVLSTPLVLMLWKRQAAAGREPSVTGKFAIGCAMLAAADLLLAFYARGWREPHSLGVLWGFGYFLLSSSAYLFVMPVLLAAVSRAAPPRLTATLMGVAYAGLFVANLSAGWLARFYEPLGPAGFWLLNAAIAGAGVLAALIFGRLLNAPLHPSSEAP